MTVRGIALVSIVAVLGTWFSSSGPTPLPTPEADSRFNAQANGKYVDTDALAWTLAPHVDVGDSSSSDVEWEQSPACAVHPGTDDTAGVYPCANPPAEPVLTCEDGSEPTMPWWWRTRPSPEAEWSAWHIAAGSWCAGAAVTAQAVAAEFARLPLPEVPVTVQPDRGWVLVNKGVIVYVDPAPAVFTVTLLGTAVTITATPSSYAWAWGDGQVTTTDEPGRPWPATDVAYPYPTLGTYQIAVTTTWTATYTVGADPTVRPVPGTAATTSTGPTFTVEELRAHLVAETCDENPDAPGC